MTVWRSTIDLVVRSRTWHVLRRWFEDIPSRMLLAPRGAGFCEGVGFPILPTMPKAEVRRTTGHDLTSQYVRGNALVGGGGETLL